MRKGKTMATKATEEMRIESLRPGLAELERALQWVARKTGVDSDPVVPVIQTKGKKANCVGWFAADSWSTREGTLCHEITFTAESLTLEPMDIIATAVHETVHLWCHSMGLKDVSGGGRHNKVFKEYAELLGLECAKPSDGRGYAYTTPSEVLEKAIEQEFKPDVAAFNVFRVAMPPKPKAASKTKAWSCGCTIVRASTEVVAVCEQCGGQFQVVE